MEKGKKKQFKLFSLGSKRRKRRVEVGKGLGGEKKRKVGVIFFLKRRREVA